VEKWKNGSVWYFRTKGDANPKVDPSAIPEDRILGIVKRVIPYVGWGKIVLMQISFIIQIAIFSCLMSFLIIKFRRIKFD